MKALLQVQLRFDLVLKERETLVDRTHSTPTSTPPKQPTWSTPSWPPTFTGS